MWEKGIWASMSGDSLGKEQEGMINGDITAMSQRKGQMGREKCH